MVNIRIAFDKIDSFTPYEMRKGKISPVCEHTNVRMIFYINMDGKFNRKSILVAGRHTLYGDYRVITLFLLW